MDEDALYREADLACVYEGCGEGGGGVSGEREMGRGKE